jgi:CubicO group peptidase (beta-lactamase class C family)
MEITLGDLATHHSGLPQEAFGDYNAAKMKTILGVYKLPRDPVDQLLVGGPKALRDEVRPYVFFRLRKGEHEYRSRARPQSPRRRQSVLASDGWCRDRG